MDDVETLMATLLLQSIGSDNRVFGVDVGGEEKTETLTVGDDCRVFSLQLAKAIDESPTLPLDVRSNFGSDLIRKVTP